MSAPPHRWWQAPRLITAESAEEERRVSWLELFFDLVFVVVVSQLAHFLGAHLSLMGVLGYGLMFLPAWWAWVAGTLYNARYETHDVSYRLFTLLQMAPVAALALFVHDGLGETSAPFAVTYALIRVLIILLWGRAGWHNPLFRPISNRYTIFFALSAACFLLSTTVPPPDRFWWWGVGLLFDFVAPFSTLAQARRLPPLSNTKLPERYGLFVIIVLGEGLVGLINGLAEGAALTWRVGLAGLLTLGVVFGLWWVYFDYIARRRFRSGPWWLTAWSYGHLPLVMALAALSPAAAQAIALEALTPGVRWLLAGTVAGALAAMAWLEGTLARDPHEPTDPRLTIPLKLVTSLLALGLAALELETLTLLLGLLGLLLIHMVYGVYVWFRHPGPPGEQQRRPAQ